MSQDVVLSSFGCYCLWLGCPVSTGSNPDLVLIFGTQKHWQPRNDAKASGAHERNVNIALLTISSHKGMIFFPGW